MKFVINKYTRGIDDIKRLPEKAFIEFATLIKPMFFSYKLHTRKKVTKNEDEIVLTLTFDGNETRTFTFTDKACAYNGYGMPENDYSEEWIEFYLNRNEKTL